MHEYFAQWAEGAYPVDQDHTAWPVSGYDLGNLPTLFVWVPPGVEHELRGSDETLLFARAAVGRLSRAIAPRP